MSLPHLITRAIEGRLVEGEAELLRREADLLQERVKELESTLQELAEWAARVDGVSYIRKISMVRHIKSTVRDVIGSRGRTSDGDEEAEAGGGSRQT